MRMCDVVTTAGGTAAPHVRHRKGSTTWPPREPQTRQSVFSSRVDFLAHRPLRSSLLVNRRLTALVPSLRFVRYAVPRRKEAPQHSDMGAEHSALGKPDAKSIRKGSIPSDETHRGRPRLQKAIGDELCAEGLEVRAGGGSPRRRVLVVRRLSTTRLWNPRTLSRRIV